MIASGNDRVCTVRSIRRADSCASRSRRELRISCSRFDDAHPCARKFPARRQRGSNSRARKCGTWRLRRTHRWQPESRWAQRFRGTELCARYELAGLNDVAAVDGLSQRGTQAMLSQEGRPALSSVGLRFAHRWGAGCPGACDRRRDCRSCDPRADGIPR